MLRPITPTQRETDMQLVLRFADIELNGHTCAVEAVITGAEAVTAETCRIRFERSLDRVSVHPDSTSEEACR